MNFAFIKTEWHLNLYGQTVSVSPSYYFPYRSFFFKCPSYVMDREAVFLWVGDTSWIQVKLQLLMLAYDLVPLGHLGMGR